MSKEILHMVLGVQMMRPFEKNHQELTAKGCKGTAEASRRTFPESQETWVQMESIFLKEPLHNESKIITKPLTEEE